MLTLSRKQHWPYSLRELDLFADCSNAELERISSLVTMLSVDAGTVLMSEGALGQEFLVIAHGSARVTADTGAVLADLGAGDFVGEMSLLTRGRRSATVVATTPLSFYVCNAAEFASLLAVAPSVATRITETASERGEANRELAA